MNTTENNKLIAEFMGVKLKGGGISIRESKPDIDKFFRLTTYEEDGLCRHCGNDVSHGHGIACYTIDDEKLKYHSSWDWIMPVVNMASYESERIRGNFEIEMWAILTNEIKSVYNSVVEFIKWYKPAEEMITIEEAKKYWEKLGECPVNDSEEIDEDLDLGIIQFSKGTSVYDIWSWFEDHFDVSVTKLMHS